MTIGHSVADLAAQLCDDVWQEQRQSFHVRFVQDLPIDRLPDVSEEAAQARAAVASKLLERLDMIDQIALSDDLVLTLGMARRTLTTWQREAEHYWLVFDPGGAGYPTMFGATAYGSGFLLGNIRKLLAGFALGSVEERDGYESLVRQYPRLLDQLRARSEGQWRRGIVMPAAQLNQALRLVERFRDEAMDALVPSVARIAPELVSWRDRIANLVEELVVPAFTTLLELLASSGYRAAAPVTVGLSQYPGGQEVYEALIHHHTSLPLSVQAVHEAGCERMKRIEREMRNLLSETGFEGTPLDYLRELGNEADWRASDEAAIKQLFHRYMDRIEPEITAAFYQRPKAPCAVEPLPAALTGAMTFGYYNPPSSQDARGIYRFNAVNLSQGALPHLAAITYHELVPGHHLHVARQFADEKLHPLRRTAFMAAYAEAWAEYAATLADEMGMYQSIEEKFGRLMMDAFLTCRLVVDTGMNALGWPLERARDYMRSRSFMAEREIASETLRYSCDMPAQALAYKLGDEYLLRLRSTMREALGDRFDIRDFHEAVLQPGTLPLPLVARNVEHVTRHLSTQCSSDT